MPSPTTAAVMAAAAAVANIDGIWPGGVGVADVAASVAKNSATNFGAARAGAHRLYFLPA